MKKSIFIVAMIVCALSLNGCGKKEKAEQAVKSDNAGKTVESVQNKVEGKAGQPSLTKNAVVENKAGETAETKLNSLWAAPDFTLPKLDGTSLKLSDFKGKIVILDFWATWCPPCRKMIPELEKIYGKFKDSGVEIIGLSLDEWPIATVKSFVENAKITYNIVLGNKETNKAYGQINAIPTSFIIDGAGQIRDKHIGFRSEEDLEKAINQLLAEKK